MPARPTTFILLFKLGQYGEALGKLLERGAIRLGALLDPIDKVDHVLPAHQCDLLFVVRKQMATVLDCGEQFVNQSTGRFAVTAPAKTVDEFAKSAQLVQLSRRHLGLEACLKKAMEARHAL